MLQPRDGTTLVGLNEACGVSRAGEFNCVAGLECHQNERDKLLTPDAMGKCIQQGIPFTQINYFKYMVK